MKTANPLKNLPWDLSYQKQNQSWAKHGLPYLFSKFISLVLKNKLRGDHVDIGCGSGIKTLEMAKQFASLGINTIGLDQTDEGFKKNVPLLKKLGLNGQFLKKSCLDTGLKAGSIASATDILMGTHLTPEEWEKYLKELNRILAPGGLMLFVLFSDQDEHFHGHKVSKRYNFEFDPQNKEMASYQHYHGMLNLHFDEADIRKLFADCFTIIELIETPHPVYPHRKLWNVIIQKPYK